ncbi:hypothetical protein [Vibrio cholerae]|uniref:hypothetical protein n=1 Tax=Vibrio cholerae TaxID=666 RepID=UPI001DA5098C|nr:hypothetical protein [Vibrio cholerae]EHU0373378.1 hypothetical protein [Vibrio cholerae]EJL6945344.1 hypothetical protein [Vibrio cholerae]EJL6982407.1 hypothetical protein [Vibrio cholerae]MEB5555082.1 hypothetical protein [Vibrio cholerae]MEB5620749.1 hypothetical protein [Vibrio cholerae]
MNISLRDLLPVVIVPIVTWIMSTYSFTEIMKERMDTATQERTVINNKLDKVVTIQGDQEVRIRLLEDGQGALELKVDKIENKVFHKE